MSEAVSAKRRKIVEGLKSKASLISDIELQARVDLTRLTEIADRPLTTNKLIKLLSDVALDGNDDLAVLVVREYLPDMYAAFNRHHVHVSHIRNPDNWSTVPGRFVHDWCHICHESVPHRSLSTIMHSLNGLGVLKQGGMKMICRVTLCNSCFKSRLRELSIDDHAVGLLYNTTATRSGTYKIDEGDAEYRGAVRAREIQEEKVPVIARVKAITRAKLDKMTDPRRKYTKTSVCFEASRLETQDDVIEQLVKEGILKRAKPMGAERHRGEKYLQLADWTRL
jgi:hypothetical protein